MHNEPSVLASDRIAGFVERARGLSRTDVEAIVDGLMERLDEINRSEEWRQAA